MPTQYIPDNAQVHECPPRGANSIQLTASGSRSFLTSLLSRIRVEEWAISGTALGRHRIVCRTTRLTRQGGRPPPHVANNLLLMLVRKIRKLHRAYLGSPFR